MHFAEGLEDTPFTEYVLTKSGQQNPEPIVLS